MAGAYNPYMQTPDYANWAPQAFGQVMQAMLLKKMFAERGVPESQKQGMTETPAMGGDQLMQAGGFPGSQGITGQAPGQMQSGQYGMDPQMLQYLFSMMGGLGR